MSFFSSNSLMQGPLDTDNTKCWIEWVKIYKKVRFCLSSYFQIITALNKSWHPDHFVCLKCDKPISGSTFNERDGSPICSDCFLQYFSEICASCKKPIKGVSTTQWFFFCQRKVKKKNWWPRNRTNFWYKNTFKMIKKKLFFCYYWNTC